MRTWTARTVVKTSADPFLQARKSGAHPSTILLTFIIRFQWSVILSNSRFYNWSLKKWSIIMTDHILPLLSWELFNALLKPAGKTIPGDHQTNDIFPQLMICLHFSFLLFVVNLLFLETDCDLAWKYFKSLIMINDEMWQSDIPRSQKDVIR